MKVFRWVLFLIFIATLESCNFNVENMPGSQISSSIKEAKQIGTFICAYRASQNIINGVNIESVFAEHQYVLGKGLFGNFTINCCESQLVIVSKDDLDYPTLDDVPQKWEIVGFEIINSRILEKDFKSINFPDRIVLEIRPDIIGHKDSIVRTTLYKIKNK